MLIDTGELATTRCRLGRQLALGALALRRAV